MPFFRWLPGICKEATKQGERDILEEKIQSLLTVLQATRKSKQAGGIYSTYMQDQVDEAFITQILQDPETSGIQAEAPLLV